MRHLMSAHCNTPQQNGQSQHLQSSSLPRPIPHSLPLSIISCTWCAAKRSVLGRRQVQKIVDDYIMGAVQDVSSRKPRLPWPTQLTEYVASVAARAQREAGDAVTMETRTGKRKRLETAKAVPEAVTAKRVRRCGAETRA
eukprot:Opistho-2@19385